MPAEPKSNNTNYITKALIAETEKRFSSAKWYLSFMGRTIEDELEFTRFYENEISTGLLILQRVTNGAFTISPILVRDVDQLLRRMLFLGYYMGGKRFDREIIGPDAAVTPAEPESSTHLSGDVSEDDFKEQDQEDE